MPYHDDRSHAGSLNLLVINHYTSRGLDPYPSQLMSLWSQESDHHIEPQWQVTLDLRTTSKILVST